MDQSHRTVLRLARRHADLDITLSGGENAHRAADMVAATALDGRYRRSVELVVMD